MICRPWRYPFHIGADSGQGRSSGDLAAGGDPVGLPAGDLCFKPAFFIALAIGSSAAGRTAVRFSSGAKATKTDVGGCAAPAATTPSNRMRDGMSHMRSRLQMEQTLKHRFEAKMQGQDRNQRGFEGRQIVIVTTIFAGTGNQGRTSGCRPS